eukprot:2001906-Rhodomonas_salina.2
MDSGINGNSNTRSKGTVQVWSFRSNPVQAHCCPSPEEQALPFEQRELQSRSLVAAVCTRPGTAAGSALQFSLSLCKQVLGWGRASELNTRARIIHMFGS